MKVSPKTRSSRFSSDILIVVEGKSNGLDATLIVNILDSLNIDKTRYYIHTTEEGNSITDVLEILRNLKNLPDITQGNIRKVIVIVDADQSYKKRREEITNALSVSSKVITLPTKGSKALRVYEESNKISCGIFLFPNNLESGSIEKLLFKSIKGHDIQFKIKQTEIYFKKLEKHYSEIGKLSENKKYKSKFRIINSIPPRDIVKNSFKNIDLNSVEMRRLRTFLCKVFEI